MPVRRTTATRQASAIQTLSTEKELLERVLDRIRQQTPPETRSSQHSTPRSVGDPDPGSRTTRAPRHG